MSDRYVTLGLARVRAPWFTEVARWATSGSLAMDFVKTVSVDEVRARLESGRAFSALLVDGGVPGVDRDLLERAGELGCAAIIVSDLERDWLDLGAVATLPSSFGPAELDALLAENASPIDRIDEIPGLVDVSEAPSGLRARSVAVTGPAGCGRSTIAMALAQGIGGDVRHRDTVVLADLALHADHALLHDARDVIPGLLELVEAHRSGTPSPGDIRALTFDVVARRYHLLLGLRRHRDWTALRPRAVRAALDGLHRTFTLVVADVDDDLENESATGSTDIEDRNLLARATVESADVVVVVGAPGLKGAHSLLRVVRDCMAAGVDPARILPVVNRAPRRRSARGELGRTFVELLAASHPDAEILSPVFVPDRRGLDELIRDGALLPDSVVDAVTTPAMELLDQVEQPAPSVADEPMPVTPGSLGSWEDEIAG